MIFVAVALAAWVLAFRVLLRRHDVLHRPRVARLALVASAMAMGLRAGHQRIPIVFGCVAPSQGAWVARATLETILAAVPAAVVLVATFYSRAIRSSAIVVAADGPHEGDYRSAASQERMVITRAPFMPRQLGVLAVSAISLLLSLYVTSGDLVDHWLRVRGKTVLPATAVYKGVRVNWNGDDSLPFELRVTRVGEEAMTGSMTWSGSLVSAVRGRVRGNQMTFVEESMTNGAPRELCEVKNVYFDPMSYGQSLVGTDSDGRVRLLGSPAPSGTAAVP